METLIDGKKYKVVKNKRLKSGDLIVYDSPYIIGYGIADKEDLLYIQNEAHFFKVVGNVFDTKKDKDILSNLSDSVVKTLITREGLTKENINIVKKDIEKEIQEFLDNC